MELAVSVAGQVSIVSTVSFSFGLPQVLRVLPRAFVDTDPSSSVTLTVRGRNLGLDDATVSVGIVLGQTGDNTRTAILPIQSAVDVIDELDGLPATDVVVGLPSGLGLNRAVRAAVYRRSGSGSGGVPPAPDDAASVVLSDPVADTRNAWAAALPTLAAYNSTAAVSVAAALALGVEDSATGDVRAPLVDASSGTGAFLSYAPPLLQSAVVYPPRSEAEKSFVRDTLGCSDTAGSGASFCGYLVVQLTCSDAASGGGSCNFGSDPATSSDTVTRQVQYLVPTTNSSSPSSGSSSGGGVVIVTPSYPPLQWDNGLITVLTRAPAASVRVSLTSASYWGVPQVVFSDWVGYATLAPQVTALLSGTVSGVPTTGETFPDLLTIAVTNMVEGQPIRVLVGGAVCPLYNSSSGMRLDAMTAGDVLVGPDGNAVLSCLIPPGQGSSAPITVQRYIAMGNYSASAPSSAWLTSPLDSSIVVSYAPPAITALTISAALPLPSISTPFSAGMQLIAPSTNGSACWLRITGSNLGPCPTVTLQTASTLTELTLVDFCAAGSGGSLWESPEQDTLLLPCPAGEGAGMLLIVAAGDQDSSSQVIVFSYAPPVVTSALPASPSLYPNDPGTGLPTIGGTVLLLHGFNFGSPFAGVQAAQLSDGGANSPYAMLVSAGGVVTQGFVPNLNDPLPPVVRVGLPSVTSGSTALVWTPCVNAQRVSDQELLCTLPEGDGASLSVEVTTLGAAASSVTPNVLSYDAPRVAIMSCDACAGTSSALMRAQTAAAAAGSALEVPAIGGASTAGGALLFLTGSNFGRPAPSSYAPQTNASGAANTAAAAAAAAAGTSPRYCVFFTWAARPQQSLVPVCDGVETFFGEGEQPSGSIVWRNHTSMVVRVPAGMGTKHVILSVGGVSSIPVHTAAPPTLNSTNTNGTTNATAAATVPLFAAWDSLAYSSYPVLAYGDPLITGITPNSGPVEGGLSVTITGVNFGGAPLNLSAISSSGGAIAFGGPTGVPLSIASQLSTAFLRITFFRACVTDQLSPSGDIPSSLSGCRYSISHHSHTSITLASAPGVGLNRTISAVVVDGDASSGVGFGGIASLETVAPSRWNYAAPTITLTLPQVILLSATSYSSSLSSSSGSSESTSDALSAATTGAGGSGSASALIDFAVSGSNYGTAADASAEGWTAAESAIVLSLGGVPCAGASRGIIGSIDVIECTMLVNTVGPKNVTLSVAGQSTEMSSSDPNAPCVACAYGLVGSIGQPCIPCPVGASCIGYDSTLAANDTGRFADPLPLPGFYNINGG